MPDSSDPPKPWPPLTSPPPHQKKEKEPKDENLDNAPVDPEEAPPAEAPAGVPPSLGLDPKDDRLHLPPGTTTLPLPRPLFLSLPPLLIHAPACCFRLLPRHRRLQQQCHARCHVLGRRLQQRGTRGSTRHLSTAPPSPHAAAARPNLRQEVFDSQIHPL